MATGLARPGRQLELPFDTFDRLEFRRNPKAIPAFWALLIKDGDRYRQEFYPLEEMEWRLKRLNPKIDAGMSQAIFENKTRRMVHVKLIGSAFFDADTVKNPLFASLPIDKAVGLILAILEDKGIPLPSVIIFSGRGYHLKWHWSSPLPRAAAGKEIAVHRSLIKKLPELYGDSSKVAMSSMLRVVGTTNQKSGLLCEVVWVNSDNLRVVTYDFNKFADIVLPMTRAELRAEREAKVRRIHAEPERTINSGWKSFCPEHWHSGVLSSILDLAKLRYGNDKVPWGFQDKFGFLAACQIVMILRKHPDVWHEIAAFCRAILPENFVDGKFRSFCSTLLERARLDADGATTTWNGKEVCNVYTYSKQTIIDILEITSDEMTSLTCLIDRSEKNRRDSEDWRAKHTGRDWEQEVAHRKAAADERAKSPEVVERLQRAANMISSGATWAQVADRLHFTSSRAAQDAVRRAILRGTVRPPVG